MDRVLYLAANGAHQAMMAQTTNANNLANSGTTGFRADFAQFRSQPVFGTGLPSRVYGMIEQPGFDTKPGPMMSTGRDLDVFIGNGGWLAVQSPAGDEALTRAGELKVSPLGVLVNGSGHPVMGNNGPIAIPPFDKLEISSDGTISIRPLGEGANVSAIIDRLKLVKPEGRDMLKGEDGLFRMKDQSIAPADASVFVTAGALEGSNVNAVEALVSIISNSRLFETQVKMMSTSEEMDESATSIIRLN